MLCDQSPDDDRVMDATLKKILRVFCKLELCMLIIIMM